MKDKKVAVIGAGKGRTCVLLKNPIDQWDVCTSGYSQVIDGSAIEDVVKSFSETFKYPGPFFAAKPNYIDGKKLPRKNRKR